MNASDWNCDRIEKIWSDLKNVLLRGDSPVKLLRRRFRKDIEPKQLTPEVSESLAELWCAWGILEAMEQLEQHSCKANRFRDSILILSDAWELAANSITRARIKFNVGSCYLLSALHADPDTHFMTQLGILQSSAIEYQIIGNRDSYKSLKKADRLFSDSWDQLNSPAVKTGYPACFPGIAYGVTAKTEPVRIRLRYIKKAVEKLNSQIPAEKELRQIGTDAVTALESLPWPIRFFGKTGKRMDIAGYFDRIRLHSLFIFPEKLNDILSQ